MWMVGGIMNSPSLPPEASVLRGTLFFDDAYHGLLPPANPSPNLPELNSSSASIDPPPPHATGQPPPPPPLGPPRVEVQQGRQTCSKKRTKRLAIFSSFLCEGELWSLTHIFIFYSSATILHHPTAVLHIGTLNQQFYIYVYQTLPDA